ncbi:MAG: hypothetical protein H6728_16635 [Myxococcales bacterium]|nr:hypothetical protein [Myxococcales bacterium]
MRSWMFFLSVSLLLLGLAPMQVGCDVKGTETVTEKKLPGQEGDIAGEEANSDAGESMPEEAVAAEKSPEVNESTPEPSQEKTPEPTPETSDAKTLAFVASSDYVSGSLGILDVKTQQWVQQDVAAISGDAVLRAWGDTVYVLNRYNDPSKEDTVLLYSTKTLKEVGKFSVGAKTNPQDIVVVSEQKAYITLYEKDYILIVDPKTGAEKGKIDISSLAESSSKTCTKDDECKDSFGNGSGVCNSGNCAADGIPEAVQMLLVQDKVYVLVQGLDRNNSFAPVSSVIATITTADDKLSASTLSMAGSNPTVFLSDAQGAWIVAQSGDAFDTKDGGLERFDASQGKLAGSFLCTEEKLGGAMLQNGAAAVFSATLGYILVSDVSYKQSLVSFNPTSGEKIKALVEGVDLGHLALHQEQLFLADRTKDSVGIRVFDAKSGSELTTKPIATGSLPPAQILIVSVAP